MSVLLRSRKKGSSIVEAVKQFDSFPKINTDDYAEKSKAGGVVSIIAYSIILLIILIEMRLYYRSDVAFHFIPDTDLNAKLKINLDITVAMPCFSVGADIVDSTSQNFRVYGTLKEEDTWFQMSPEQRAHFDDIRYFNSYLRGEYHAVNDILWKSAHTFQPASIPKLQAPPNQMPDACRIYGSMELTKVAGNLHITSGKPIFLTPGRGHMHFPLGTSFLDGIPTQTNFSHRIHHLSFGDSSVGIIHPLDGDEAVTLNGNTLYQYFIEIVPTDVETFLSQAKTYQYSVTENIRFINHDTGSHGVPGIFFKYDFSALKVIVSQTGEPLFQFLIRLSSIVSGIFIVAGLLLSFVLAILKKMKLYKINVSWSSLKDADRFI